MSLAICESISARNVIDGEPISTVGELKKVLETIPDHTPLKGDIFNRFDTTWRPVYKKTGILPMMTFYLESTIVASEKNNKSRIISILTNLGRLDLLESDPVLKDMDPVDGVFEKIVRSKLADVPLQDGSTINLWDIMCKNPCMTKDHVDLIGKLADCGELTHDNIDALCQLDL